MSVEMRESGVKNLVRTWESRSRKIACKQPVVASSRQEVICLAPLSYIYLSTLHAHIRMIAAVDGTFRYCARPTSLDVDYQRALYNGYYGGHGFKYSATVAPNGLCIDLYGPECGCNHDNFLLGMSGLIGHLKELPAPDPPTNPSLAGGSGNIEGQHHRYYVYGDPAYCCTGGVILSGYKDDYLQEWKKDFNRRHNRCRVAVEMYFSLINKNFPAMKFTSNEKPLVSPIAVRYMLAGLLTNLKTCMEGGNEISEMFACDPPTLNEYLSLPKVNRHGVTLLVDESNDS